MNEFTKPIAAIEDQATAVVKSLQLINIAILVTTIVIIGLLVFVFANRYIISPVAMLERRATEISLGRNLNQTIVASSKDEIGSLAEAIERSRISRKTDTGLFRQTILRPVGATL